MKYRANSLRINPQLLLPVIIVAAGVLAYTNSFSGAFIYDDVYTITRGYTLWRSWLTGEGVFFSWRPIADATFALNYAIGRLKAADYHAVNLAVHLVAALLLYGIVRRTLVIRGHTLNSIYLAFASSVIWVVHPLTTASVTYISQRYESLMSMFYLLTLYCVIRGASSRRMMWWYVSAVFSCAMGMGSKEVMITAPIAVLVYDWIFLSEEGSLKRLFMKRWGLYAGLAGTWLILALLMKVKLRLDDSSFYVWKEISPLSYAATEMGVICRYLRLALWPAGLCFDYTWPVAERMSDILLPGIIVAVLVSTTTVAVYKRWGWGFPGALFFLVLAPTSSFIPRPDPIVEHRMYLPLAGVIVFAVIVLNGILHHIAFRLVGVKGARWTAGAALSAAIVVLGGLTINRNAIYGSEETVWRSVTADMPENMRAQLGIGAFLLTDGQHDQAEVYFERILGQIGDISESTPAHDVTVYAMTHNNLGVICFREGRYGLAADHFREAVRVAPENMDARRNLSRCLSKQASAQ